MVSKSQAAGLACRLVLWFCVGTALAACGRETWNPAGFPERLLEPDRGEGPWPGSRPQGAMSETLSFWPSPGRSPTPPSGPAQVLPRPGPQGHTLAPHGSQGRCSGFLRAAPRLFPVDEGELVGGGCRNPGEDVVGLMCGGHGILAWVMVKEQVLAMVKPVGGPK